MSIWFEGAKGKVYNLESTGNMVKAKFSTSEKDKDGNWQSSNWFVAFVGNCKAAASQLSDGDKITVTKGKISNVYNKERKQAYLNLVIFAFDTEEKKEEFGDFRMIENESEIPF